MFCAARRAWRHTWRPGARPAQQNHRHRTTARTWPSGPSVAGRGPNGQAGGGAGDGSRSTVATVRHDHRVPAGLSSTRQAERSWGPRSSSLLCGTSVGLARSRTVSALIWQRPTSLRDGSSYIVLSRTSSRMARSPRAPVWRRIARSAIASSASVLELELDAVELEEPLVLLGERVLRPGEDVDQRVAVERLHRRDDRQPADELGNQPVADQVLGQHVAQQLGEVLVARARRPPHRTRRRGDPDAARRSAPDPRTHPRRRTGCSSCRSG
jgi:hypothetical protein